MDPSFALIRDVTPLKSDWLIYVRLVQCYHMPLRRNPNIILTVEWMFEDFEGDRIHCTIEDAALLKFRSSPVEGFIYAIREFLVVQDTSPYKTTTNRNKILFTENIKMVEIVQAQPVSHIRQDKRFTKLANVTTIDGLRTWLDVACIQCMHWFNSCGEFIACNKCGSRNPSFLLRPKLGVILTDELGIKRLTFWEKESVHLISY